MWPVGMTTRQPAASIASTQATPTSVCRRLLKVSGNRITRGPVGLTTGRFENHCCSVIGAKVGSGRRRSIPPTALAIRESTGVWVAKFATSGMALANRAARSMNPNAYAYRGRQRRSDRKWW